MHYVSLEDVAVAELGCGWGMRHTVKTEDRRGFNASTSLSTTMAQ